MSFEFPFPFVDNYDVKDASFFRRGRSLPTPDEVRKWANRATTTGGSSGPGYLRPPVQRYRNLDLAVKYGNHVSIAEAHCLLFLRKHAPTIPVPELFGWRRDRQQTFLYMQYIEGINGASVPSSPNVTNSAAAQLEAVVATLRQIPQSLVSSEAFVGHVNGTHLRDWCIVNSATPTSSAGPFPSVAAFHDWFAFEHGMPASNNELPATEAGRYRSHLPDGDDGDNETADDRYDTANADAAIRLTHGGLTLDNIIVSQPRFNGPVTLLAVVDWSQAGWYPAYWEDLRMTGKAKTIRREVYMNACDFFNLNAGK